MPCVAPKPLGLMDIETIVSDYKARIQISSIDDTGWVVGTKWD